MTEELTPVATAGHRIMLDSTNPAAVLAAVKAKMMFRGMPISLVGGYVDGRFAWPASAWAELAAAGIAAHQQVGITVFGQSAAAAKAGEGDSEPGDMTPAQVAAWARREHDSKHWPVPYCSRSDKPKVIAECRKLGLRLSDALSSDYGLSVATLDGTFHDIDPATGEVDPSTDLRTEPGIVAIQYTQATSPIHVAGTPPDLDVSLVVRPSWRAVAVPPKPRFGYLVPTDPPGTPFALTSTDGKTWH